MQYAPSEMLLYTSGTGVQTGQWSTWSSHQQNSKQPHRHEEQARAWRNPSRLASCFPAHKPCSRTGGAVVCRPECTPDSAFAISTQPLSLSNRFTSPIPVCFPRASSTAPLICSSACRHANSGGDPEPSGDNLTRGTSCTQTTHDGVGENPVNGVDFG